MKLFRELTKEEEQKFRQWARENYTPYGSIEGVWHPVIQDECVRMNREAEAFPEE
jgi:hypothetical protein